MPTTAPARTRPAPVPPTSGDALDQPRADLAGAAGTHIPWAGIASVASAVPERVVSSAEIGARLGVEDDWIPSRTGVRERRHLGAGERLTDLAAGAAGEALERAGLEAGDLDLILFATFTADELQPHAAPALAGELGATRAGAIDVGAACTGFISALALGTAQIEASRAASVLVVGADAMSRVLDLDDRVTAGLFGDGAGAAVLTAGGPGRVGAVRLRSDPEGASLITAGHADRLIRMDGRATYRAAVAGLAEITEEVLAAAGLEPDQVDLFVYHQANRRIVRAVGERLSLEPGRVADSIDTFGNTSAASVPIALCEAAGAGQLRAGATVLLGAFGAGFTSGAGLIEWEGSA